MASMRERLAARAASTVKRGDALFDGTDYPRTWDAYVGQSEAKAFLRAAARSAKIRKTRMDHTLIASGQAGIGKSALVRLIAQDLDVGLAELQGAVDVNDALRALSAMQDGDILFLDEIHLMVSGGRAKSEWLLSFLQDGVIVTPAGVHSVPKVTVIGATTDAQKLPEAVLSRFTVKPVLESYTDEEADKIVDLMGRRLFREVGLQPPGEFNREAIVSASNKNPRVITQLVRILRDSILDYPQPVDSWVTNCYPMDKMFAWSKLTHDGLDRTAQEFLSVLAISPSGRAGEKTIAQALGEPTFPRHTEKLLLQKGYIRICAQGRELTPEGLDRAMELAAD